MGYLSPNRNTYLIFSRKHDRLDAKPQIIQ